MCSGKEQGLDSGRPTPSVVPQLRDWEPQASSSQALFPPMDRDDNPYRMAESSKVNMLRRTQAGASAAQSVLGVPDTPGRWRLLIPCDDRRAAGRNV